MSSSTHAPWATRLAIVRFRIHSAGKFLQTALQRTRIKSSMSSSLIHGLLCWANSSTIPSMSHMSCSRWESISSRSMIVNSERIGPVVTLRLCNVTFTREHVYEIIPCFTLSDGVTFPLWLLLCEHLPIITKLRDDLCLSVTHVVL